MGYILIFVIIASVTGLIGHFLYKEFGLGCIVGILIAIIPFFVTVAIIHFLNDSEEYVYSETEILALKDNISSEGQFFLGSGYIEGQMNYFYMVERSHGYQIKNINAESSYLIESDIEDPVIRKVVRRFKKDWVQAFFPFWSTGRTEIIIPEGSIKYNYNVNLE